MNSWFLGEGIFKDFGKVMYTLLYLKLITNKDLLYSIWNSTQCLCTSLDGRGFGGRKDTCICMTESLHYLPETITILLIGSTPIQNVFGVKKRNKMKIKHKEQSRELNLCLVCLFSIMNT